MASNGWDAEDNSPEVSELRGPEGIRGIGRSGYSGFSAYSGYASNHTISTSNNLNVLADEATITINAVDLQATSVNLNPQVSWASSVEPVYLSPISFTFYTSSWQYTLCYMLNVLFSPWLIVWSKVIGRTTGFRIRNPRRG